MTTKYNRSSFWIVIVAAFFATFQYAGCAGTATSESTGEYIDDATITTKVKAAFASDNTVSAIDVKVETFKGTVSLSGFVDTKEQKKQAETIAKGVNGVRKVINNITVK